MDISDKEAIATMSATQKQYHSDASVREQKNKRTPRRKKVFTLIFGISSLLFAIIAATFASIISLLGFSSVFTGAGLIPMASCLFLVLSAAVPAIIFGILSRRLGTVCGLNKVSVALSISSAAASIVIFFTLVALSLIDRIGFIF